MTVAKSMMEKMGWKEGDGLGKEGQGIKTAIKPKKKIDATGIGAKNLNTNWIATSSAYDSILAKLNITYSGGAGNAENDEPKPDVELSDKAKAKAARKAERRARKAEKAAKQCVTTTEEVEVTESVEIASGSRHAIYSRRLKSKQMKRYSDVDKAEIFAHIHRPDVADGDAPLAVHGLSTTPNPTIPSRISYEGGFTEDTQVDIYNQAMGKQVKNRLGLGQVKLSKSARREAAQSDAHLTNTGNYLQRKFVYSGCLSEMALKMSKSPTPEPARPSKRSRDESSDETASGDDEEARRERKRLRKEEKRRAKAAKKQHK